MRKEWGNEHIPKQEVGEQMDVMEKRSFENEAMSIAFFKKARQRLLDVNRWANSTSHELSDFRLTNSFGHPIEGLARHGDYIRIDIPGPGPSAGKGYDWVLVESIVEDSEIGMELVSMQVRPTASPLSDSQDTAHFLTEQATSNFQVKRIGLQVVAEEHGRNEQANTYTTSTKDNIRNRLAGWAAMLGLSYPQWKTLVKGIIADD